MRVLIVEDEPVIALEIESIVQERIPGADVLVTTSVCEALEAVDDTLAMAFLDVDVTDGKTYPLALELRLKRIPFVFVSGAARSDAPNGLADAGFIPKPFCPGDIHKAIGALEAERPGAAREAGREGES